MNLSFLKFNKNKLPSPASMKPPLFKAGAFWFQILLLCLVILSIVFWVGTDLLYSQYSESYKPDDSLENFDSQINIDGLKNAIEKRNNFINQETRLPRDPSI